MWDFSDYDTQDLKDIYNALDNLATYNLHNEEMFNEVNKELENRECKKCGRTGQYDYNNPDHESRLIFTDECNECNGTGYIK